MKKRALISLSDKTGAVEFALGLKKLGFEIISTGGTAKALTDAGIEVISISDVTGFPECLDGRVKTLHPAVHAGLLALRHEKAHMATLESLKINTIDVVAVNLYPFEATIKKPNSTFEDAVENIDIGGPAMLRSAAKNYAGVLVVVDPADYSEVLDRLKSKTDDIAFRLKLMTKVYTHTAAYDGMIAEYLAQKTAQEEVFPDLLTLRLKKVQDLRYGENPHQKAAFYAENGAGNDTLAKAKQLWGKELSFNNLNDAFGAIELVKEFKDPAAVAVKHAAPCGVALGKDILEAYAKAHACDPVSVYGGIVAVNRKIDLVTANEMLKTFLEVIIAPDFAPEALEAFKRKPSVRLLQLEDLDKQTKPYLSYKRVEGGFVVQQNDGAVLQGELKTVTQKIPSSQELKQLEFAFTVVKHTRSNAIVLAKDFCAYGIAGGQTNRIWAAKQAIERAGGFAKGAVVASDAFFPFSDCVEALAAGGVTSIIQPGGSVRDEESINACNKLGLAMVFTGIRHFKH